MAIATVNPATGETVKTFDALSVDELDARIARADEAFQSYRLTSFAQRAEWMRAAADILENEVDAIAAVMTTEMGKTLKAAKAEALKCAKACRFYAEHAEEFLADEPADPKAVGAQRAQWMRAAADRLEAEQDDVGALMTLEMGKTLAAAKAEVVKCATACRFYAEHAERFLAD